MTGITLLTLGLVLALSVRWWVSTEAPGAVIGRRLLRAATAGDSVDRDDVREELGSMIDGAAADGRQLAAMLHGASSIRMVRLRPAPRAGLEHALPRWGWSAWLVLALILTAVHGWRASPLDGKSSIYTGLQIATLLVLAIAIGRGGGLIRSLLALGVASFIAADMSYAAFEPTTFPSIADPLYISTYPLLAAGAMLLIRSAGGRGWRWLALATLASLAAGATWWIRAGIGTAGGEPLVALVGVSYSALDVGLVVMAVGVVVAMGRLTVPSLLLLAAAISLTIADFGYGFALLDGDFESGLWIDSFWLAFFPLASAAVLHPSTQRRFA